MSRGLEETTFKALQEEALAVVRTEHAQYFAALEKHPRLLVGTEVPAIGKEGTEKLKDTDDAKEWQEAVKSILIEEVREKARVGLDEKAEFMATMHQSIELFQNNIDLIPGTKGFNLELANRFATMAAPYELRVEGKLHGYSIPVQPLIDTIRAQLIAAAPAAPTGAPAAAPAATPEPPQAGITSKAGGGDAGEDFSTLFGTIGLPNLRI